jgi:hypothetical protein
MPRSRPAQAIYDSKSALGRIEEFFEARLCGAGTLAHVGTGAPARPVEQSSTVLDVAHTMAVLNTTRGEHDFRGCGKTPVLGGAALSALR